MVNYHVIDIKIDALHVKRQLYLPVYIKRITGVLFFPVVPIPQGIPDGNPLGVAALSLQNEKVNVVTNVMVFKKAPCYYQGKDLSDANGETFLDSGYSGHKDFFACNDAVSPNSYLVFKYTNRKNITSLTEDEQWEIDLQRLNNLNTMFVKFRTAEGYLSSIYRYNNYVKFTIYSATRPEFTLTRSELKKEIYDFQIKDGDNFRPAYNSDDKDHDEAYNLKIILRHDIE